MAKQNIYDNETFFEGYKKLRDNEINANNLFEKPALFSLLPELKVSAVPKLIKDGVIAGGMIPKVDCCVESVREGVHQANIQDGRVEHSILIELFSDQGVGTMFY